MVGICQPKQYNLKFQWFTFHDTKYALHKFNIRSHKYIKFRLHCASTTNNKTASTSTLNTNFSARLHFHSVCHSFQYCSVYNINIGSDDTGQLHKLKFYIFNGLTSSYLKGMKE